MRYKNLNKTILTGALFSLISLSTGQSLAQEVFDTESDDVLSVLPSSPEAQVEDDIIPVSSEALIAPQNKEVVSEPKKEAPVQEDFVPDDFLKAPQEKEVKPAEVPATAANTNAPKETNVILEQEGIKAPIQADLLPMEDDFEIDFGNEGDVIPSKAEPSKLQNTPQESAQAPKAGPKNAPKVNQPVVHARPNVRGIQKNDVSKELNFGEAILVQTNNDLFSQMSDIEKQTTLLTLELKKEKIKNEIEAAKAIREKAAFEKQASEEAKKRAQIEWEKEQESKVILAEAELKQKEIELEKLKQRKALTAYMNSMLEQKQSWVVENAKLYDEIKSLKDKNKEMRQTYQKSLNDISSKMVGLMQSAETAQKDHDRAIVSLTAQNTQLKKRIEATEKAAQASDGNPFATAGANVGGKVQTSADSLIAPMSVASEYAIVEILGKGDTLTVKLMNKDGETFIAKRGTVLQTGHMVEEITPKFVRFSRNGLEDFLYTSSTPMEVEQNSLSGGDKSTATDPKKSSATKAEIIPLIKEIQKNTEDDGSFNIISESSLPSLGTTMFIK